MQYIIRIALLRPIFGEKMKILSFALKSCFYHIAYKFSREVDIFQANFLKYVTIILMILLHYNRKTRFLIVRNKLNVT